MDGKVVWINGYIVIFEGIRKKCLINIQKWF